MPSVDRILALKLVTDVGELNKGTKAIKQWGKALAAGVVIDGVERVVDTLSDAWDGFRSGQKVAAQLGVAWKNMGFEGKALSSTLQKVTDSTLALGTSDDEAVKAFTNSLKWTKSYNTSLKDLTIAQDLVANGSAPDLASAFEIIRKVGQGAKRTLDKFGISGKTAGDRIEALGRKVKGAAKKAADLDPLAVVTNKIQERLEGAVGAFTEGDLNGSLASLASIGTDIDTAWSNVFPKFSEWADKITGGAFSGLAADIGGVATAIGGLVDKAKPLVDLFSSATQGGIGFLVNEVVNTLRVMADLIKGDFSKAWEDTGKLIKGILDPMIGLVQTVFGALRDGWNSLDFAIPAGSFQFTPSQHFDTPFGPLDIPAIGFSWAGTGDLIPDIGGGKGGYGGRHTFGTNAQHGGAEGHKGGLARVPYDEYPAMLHKNEAVLKASDAEQWRHGGSGGGGVTINFNGLVTDPVSAGREVIRAIQEYEKRGSRSWRAA